MRVGRALPMFKVTYRNISLPFTLNFNQKWELKEKVVGELSYNILKTKNKKM